MIPARIVGIIILLIPGLSYASSDAHLCDAAATNAAFHADIPPQIMLALTRVETGRTRESKLQPWPWTVNLEGKGFWFETRTEAEEFAIQNYRLGARSFDVGCFQINYRWHGHAFANISRMFEPSENANYAANFLKSLYKESDSWSWAAGAYHSRTTALSTKYRARFDRIFANISSNPLKIEPLAATASTTLNRPVKISMWSPLQPPDTAPIPPKNGSLSGWLIQQSGASLLTKPAKALY